jgi:uncharacterized protein YdiU (UPF0061 family)
LESVIARQADLVVQWLLVGFIHGVMNTDNMTISGETIDYGPCAFMDAYDPATVYSSIDSGGRYAYGNQPSIALWNLTRLAETLLPLLAEDENAAVEIAQSALAAFAARFQAAYAAGLNRKLGLLRTEPDDFVLAQDLLHRMTANGADFTLTFRRLSDAVADPSADAPVRSLFANPETFDEWAAQWRARLLLDGNGPVSQRAVMRAANPAFIPRNHRVEEAINAAVERNEFAPFETLIAVLRVLTTTSRTSRTTPIRRGPSRSCITLSAARKSAPDRANASTIARWRRPLLRWPHACPRISRDSYVRRSRRSNR